MDKSDQNPPPDRQPLTGEDDFEMLAIRYLEGMHEEPDARLLDEQLKSDPRARDIYAALSIQLGVLSDSSLVPGKSAAGNSKSITWLSAPLQNHRLNNLWESGGSAFNGNKGGTGFRFHAFLIAVCAFVAGGLLSWGIYSRTGVLSVPSVDSPRMATVAYLTSTNGCAWGGDSVKTWTVGHSIESGSEIALHEGVAEFRMANGISLGVEGPASVLLASPSKLVLQYGKLTAHVPWGAEDFKVFMAGCRIMAHDAELGLSLTGNKLDIHVFSGEVAAASSIASAEFDEEDFVASDSYFSDAMITAGRTLRLMAQGEVLRVVGWDKAVPGKFVAKLSMSGPLPVTQDYVNQVTSSKPIGYWRFEQIADLQVPNEIHLGAPLKITSAEAAGSKNNKQSADSRNTLIAGNRSVLVGSKENLSLEFRPDSCWFLESKAPLLVSEPEYSMEVWLKPSHLHLGSVVSLEYLSGSRARLELQGNIGDSFDRKHSGELRYVQRLYDGKSGNPIVSCFSPRPYAVRRWQHVVAVKTATEMKLYLDGKFVSSVNESPSPSGDAMVVVGLFELNRNRRKFIGQIDELAVYGRALTKEEIVRHYEAVDQVAKGSKPKGVSRRINQMLNEA